MRVALVNPPWTFENSIYFGCRAPHLPLELGYSKALLEAAGHEALMLDAHLCGTPVQALAEAVAAFAPDMTVVSTAPTYLFWRCAQPELRVPREFLAALGGRGGRTVAVGPHGSATPKAALAKLGADVVVRGECEEVVARLAGGGDLRAVPSIAFREGEEIRVTGGPAAARFADLPALRWPDAWIARHRHHHHRFDAEPDGPGAEVEASRGCPYTCTFCAKIDFRDAYRRRELPIVLEEIDGLVAQGAAYVYFVDEIFLPQRPLLEALVSRPVRFGVQTRIDLWKPDMLDLLGAAGCVSIEAGVESLTEEGRAALDKRCRSSTDDLAERLIHARRSVPFVQANLIKTEGDDPETVADWRDRLRRHGVWANDPVPLYPYPSSPDYRRLWGAPDDQAWERAHAHYLAQFQSFSDIQEDRPAALAELEAGVLPLTGGRVLLTADAVGGVWTYALDLAAGLAARGIATALAVLGPAPAADQARAARAVPGLRLLETGLPLEWLADTPEEVEAAGAALAALASEAGADVFHLHSAALAAGAAGRFPAPVVASCHSCVGTWWEAVRGGPVPPDFAWRSRLVAHGCANADALLAPTAAFAAATARFYGLAAPPIVVRNGRGGRLPPRAVPEGDAAPHAFTAGRLWDEGKNLRALDRAAARLAGSVPVLAAGPTEGPGGARVALRHVRALGRLGQDEVAARLAERPVFVSAARYEPFGLSVLEAARAGCALVLSDVRTFRELWDGAAAFVPADDDRAIAAAMERAVRDPDHRARLGAAARERADGYTAEAMADGTAAVYRALLRRAETAAA